ncbi:MAG TPA: DUF308 domain-containing protein [Candidatus Onthocola stercorigallinarum]|nr:DUF308 domain-containing protein [Candidatus Onthocola stercorigallinarum]
MKKKKEKVEATLEEKTIDVQAEVKISNNDDISKTLILALIGLVLLLLPSTLNNIIGFVVGGCLLIFGIIGIIKYIRIKEYKFTSSLVSGILYSALGIIVIINPSSVISLVTICLGLYLVINGILKTVFSFNLKKITTRWSGALVMGLLTIVLGLLLVINPFGSAVAITKLAGAFLVVVAIFDLVDRYIIMK